MKTMTMYTFVDKNYETNDRDIFVCKHFMFNICCFMLFHIYMSIHSMAVFAGMFLLTFQIEWQFYHSSANNDDILAFRFMLLHIITHM